MSETKSVTSSRELAPFLVMLFASTEEMRELHSNTDSSLRYSRYNSLVVSNRLKEFGSPYSRATTALVGTRHDSKSLTHSKSRLSLCLRLFRAL